MSAPSVADDWRDQIIYQIFVDRFAGYDPAVDPMEPQFVGGKIAGITRNLEYVKELGATCIYLTPFLKGASYHGYHVTDLFEMDQRFGTLSDIQELADRIHALDMRLMIDLVPNHCFIEHPYFRDAQRNWNSPYHDWFTFKKWPETYLSFLDIRVLPKLNLDNAQTRKHVIDSALFWVDKLDIDGIRLDHVIGPSLDFWQEFAGKVRAAKPRLFLLAEVSLYHVDMRRHAQSLRLPLEWSQLRRLKTLNERHRALFEAYGDVFDGYIDFAFNEVIRDFAAGVITEERARKVLERHYAGLPRNVVFPTQLDNHDHDRIMFITGGDVERVEAAISLQFSYHQPHIIYYGTEIGLTQSDPGGPLDEFYFGLLARQPMPDLSVRPTDHPVQMLYRELASRRAAKPQSGG
jgi:cyclomaltodextrinase